MNNETKTSGVPKLNLAPRLTRPLSLWNPLDYLRLLYWVFYFPQAIRWYVELFAREEENLREIKEWKDFINWWQNNPIQSKLWLQGISLHFFIPLTSFSLQLMGIQISWDGINFILTFGLVGVICIPLEFLLRNLFPRLLGRYPILMPDLDVLIVLGVVISISGGIGVICGGLLLNLLGSYVNSIIVIGLVIGITAGLCFSVIAAMWGRVGEFQTGLIFYGIFLGAFMPLYGGMFLA